MTSDQREVCFTISTLDAKGKRRKTVQPVWLNKRQLEGLMLLHYNKELPWTKERAKTWRELKEKRMVLKLHKGFRFYHAALTSDGELLAKYIEEAANQEAAKAKAKTRAKTKASAKRRARDDSEAARHEANQDLDQGP